MEKRDYYNIKHYTILYKLNFHRNSKRKEMFTCTQTLAFREYRAYPTFFPLRISNSNLDTQNRSIYLYYNSPFFPFYYELKLINNFVLIKIFLNVIMYSEW